MDERELKCKHLKLVKCVSWSWVLLSDEKQLKTDQKPNKKLNLLTKTTVSAQYHDSHLEEWHTKITIHNIKQKNTN